MYRFLILVLLLVSCNQHEVKKATSTNNAVTTPKNSIEKIGESVISIDSIQLLFSKFDDLKEAKPATNYPTVCISGDFYGDGMNDVAVLAKSSKSLEIVVFNFNEQLE